jgi:hypothetical protein
VNVVSEQRVNWLKIAQQVRSESITECLLAESNRMPCDNKTAQTAVADSLRCSSAAHRASLWARAKSQPYSAHARTGANQPAERNRTQSYTYYTAAQFAADEAKLGAMLRALYGADLRYC